MTAKIRLRKVSMYNIIAVVVTYADRFHLLKQTVESALTEGVTKIIVIDNNSSSNSKDQLKVYEKEMGSDKMQVFYSDDNYGSAGGFKRGLEEAYRDSKCEFIWLLDDDNQPQKDSLNILRDYWNNIVQDDKNEKVALLSCRRNRESYREAVMINNPDLVLGRKNSFLGFHIVDLSKKVLKVIKRKLGVQTFIEDKKIQSGKVSVAPYGGMFFHKKIIESIGYPNANFFLYHDDHDWSYRIIQNRGDIYVVLDSIIDDIDASWNLKEKSTSPFYAYLNEGNEFRVYYSVRNKVYFEKNIVTNNMIYNIHMRLFLFIILFYKRKKNKSQYNMFRKAIQDGLNNKLGKII